MLNKKSVVMASYEGDWDFTVGLMVSMAEV